MMCLNDHAARFSVSITLLELWTGSWESVRRVSPSSCYTLKSSHWPQRGCSHMLLSRDELPFCSEAANCRRREGSSCLWRAFYFMPHCFSNGKGE